MPASNAKTLSTLFRSAIKTAAAAADDVTLKTFVSSLDTSSSSSSPSTSAAASRPLSPPKRRSKKKSAASKAVSDYLSGSSYFSRRTAVTDFATESLDTEEPSDFDLPTIDLSSEISSILCGGTSPDTSSDSLENNDGKPPAGVLEMPWFSSLSHSNISLRRKEVARDRKAKWVFKITQNHRTDRLVNTCGLKLGTDKTLEVFGKLGRETGVKEYNSLIKLCIETARRTEDENVLVQYICEAYQILKVMGERGFQLEEESYGPLLMFLIDMEMVEDFQYLCEEILNKNSNSPSRLAYYQMLLWVRVDNEHKIKELCDFIATNNDGGNPNFKENYLLALCESDRKEELLLLLESIDITKIESLDHLTNIFRSLGRLLLESFADKYFRELKSSDIGAENISNFIYDYAVSVPNLAVEDVISKFKHLHEELEVMPSSASYEKLIGHCCEFLKAHVALDVVDQMSEAGLPSSIEMFHSILYACEESCDFNLVHRIYSMIRDSNLKPNNETFRIMISLRAKMKDFEGAYSMLRDVEEINLMPTANMYNAIMAGYFREKNIHGALMVLKHMEKADVKPDSQTFSYLIGNCHSEEDIVKYYEELQHSGVQITKYILMALVNAYANCGQFEKAKQVVLDKGLPVQSLNEMRSVLASALASHGQISDALNIYEEVKQAECNLDPRTIICLIENLQSKGQLSRLLQLLEELKDSDYWIDGCCRVILYCVQYKHLSSCVDLLKLLMDQFRNDEVATENLFDEVFSKIAETEPLDCMFGLNLLQAIKEQLGVFPSRKSLDFLLSACANAKDLQSSLLVWKEYHLAGLPYNVISYLRMYQALLASGDHKGASKKLSKMPKDDPHVCCVIKACQKTYAEPTISVTGKKKKKKK